MPMRPASRCSTVGCAVLVPAGGVCATHQRAREQRRGSSTARGYDRHWQRARRRYLSQPENITCRMCAREGRCEPATVVDHITPHRGDQALFWNVANWQPLCKAHHDQKTGAGS